jgi:hypothetical protein
MLETTQAKIELQIGVSDDKIAYLDYLLEKLEDDAYATAQAIALLGEKTGETMTRIATYTAGLEELLSHHNITPE